MSLKYKRSIVRAFSIPILIIGIASVLGFILRLAFSIDLPDSFDYVHIRHSHSHGAMLGWLFASFILLVIYFFRLPWEPFKNIYYSLQAITIVLIISMLISGYSLFSIALSSLHIIVSYIFLYKIGKNLVQHSKSGFGIIFIITANMKTRTTTIKIKAAEEK